MSMPVERLRLTRKMLCTWLVYGLTLGAAFGQECSPAVGSLPGKVILGSGGAQFFPKNTNCPDRVVAPECVGGTVLRHKDATDPDRLTRYACVASPENGQDLPLLIHFHGSRTPTADVSFAGYLGRPAKTDLLARMSSASLAPGKTGYILLMPQGRCITAPPGSSGDGMHHDVWFKDAQNNLDILAAQAFIQQLFDRTTLNESGTPIPLPANLATVDPKRIYLMGHSNGAFFAHLLGLLFPNQFAAVATAAGADTFARGPCPVPYPGLSRRIPIMVVHATCDPLVLCDCDDCSEDTPTVEKWINTLSNRGWEDDALHDIITDTSHVQVIRSCQFATASRQKLCPSSAHEFPNPQLPSMFEFLGRHALP